MERVKSTSDLTLSPCPFCGKRATLHLSSTRDGTHYYYLGCVTEDCRESVANQDSAFPQGKLDEEVAAWNRRPARYSYDDEAYDNSTN